MKKISIILLIAILLSNVGFSEEFVNYDTFSDYPVSAKNYNLTEQEMNEVKEQYEKEKRVFFPEEDKLIRFLYNYIFSEDKIYKEEFESVEEIENFAISNNFGEKDKALYRALIEKQGGYYEIANLVKFIISEFEYEHKGRVGQVIVSEGSKITTDGEIIPFAWTAIRTHNNKFINFDIFEVKRNFRKLNSMPYDFKDLELFVYRDKDVYNLPLELIGKKPIYIDGYTPSELINKKSIEPFIENLNKYNSGKLTKDKSAENDELEELLENLNLENVVSKETMLKLRILTNNINLKNSDSISNHYTKVISNDLINNSKIIELGNLTEKKVLRNFSYYRMINNDIEKGLVKVKKAEAKKLKNILDNLKPIIDYPPIAYEYSSKMRLIESLKDKVRRYFRYESNIDNEEVNNFVKLSIVDIEKEYGYNDNIYDGYWNTIMLPATMLISNSLEEAETWKNNKRTSIDLDMFFFNIKNIYRELVLDGYIRGENIEIANRMRKQMFAGYNSVLYSKKEEILKPSRFITEKDLKLKEDFYEGLKDTLDFMYYWSNEDFDSLKKNESKYFMEKYIRYVEHKSLSDFGMKLLKDKEKNTIDKISLSVKKKFDKNKNTLLKEKNNINILENGRIINIDENLEFDSPAFIEDSKTYVPLRELAEKNNFTVKWNEVSKTIDLEKEERKISLKVGDRKIISNKEEVFLDKKIETFNGRTYVPIRFILEELDLNVYWIGKDGGYIFIY